MAIKRSPRALKMQTDELTAMKADLIQKSSVYSDEFPAIKALKSRIATLEQQIAKTRQSQTDSAAGQDIDALSSSRIPSKKNWMTKVKS